MNTVAIKSLPFYFYIFTAYLLISYSIPPQMMHVEIIWELPLCSDELLNVHA